MRPHLLPIPKVIGTHADSAERGRTARTAIACVDRSSICGLSCLVFLIEHLPAGCINRRQTNHLAKMCRVPARRAWSGHRLGSLEVQSAFPNIVPILPPRTSQIDDHDCGAIDLDSLSEIAWLGAVGWLDAGGPGTLPYGGGPDDAQGEWNQALLEAATEEVLFAGFDLDVPGVEEVVWDAAWDAGHDHHGAAREPIGLNSPFSSISVRWREMFPETEALMTRLRRSGVAFRGKELEPKKEEAILELRAELWAEIFKHGFRWSSDEWWPVSADIAVSMYLALTVEQMCRLVWCLRWRDVAGATSLLDLVSNHDEKQGHSYFNRLALGRDGDGEIRIHVAQLPNPLRLVSLNETRVSYVRVQRRTGARRRSSRGRATRVRGSKRVTSRSTGGGDSGDPDEPKRVFGPLPGSVVALLFAVAFYGNSKLASAIAWKGAGGVLLIPVLLILSAATVESVLGFIDRVWRAICPIRSRFMIPPTDPKDGLRESVRAAQERYEADIEATREARRQAFATAQAEGLSLREISEEVGLHLSRIGQIIEGK
jgi:hypothetical protein